MLAPYTTVKLATDRFVAEGAQRGMVGAIIEVYADGHYEVEFSDPVTGVTIAQIVAEEAELLPRIELGHYGCVDPRHDNDPYEHGQYLIELRQDGAAIAFIYSYESRSNHGFSLDKHRGVVTDPFASPLEVELIERTASGYEDYYKEDLDSHSTERVRVTLERIGDKLRYAHRLYAIESH
ncbi:MAG: DUF4926 domain-containing protein [Kofleriaceae bacterium]